MAPTTGHNIVVNVALAFFKYELKFSGSTGSVDSNFQLDSVRDFVGTSANGKSKHTDGQVLGSPFWLRRLAFDVSIVNPTAISHWHSGAGACGESGCRGSRRNLASTNSCASSVVWTLYRSSSQRVGGWESNPSGDWQIASGHADYASRYLH